MNLAEVIAESIRSNPDVAAFIMSEGTLTYRELWDRSSDVCALLVDNGIGAGDRVLLYADNCPEAFVVYLATARIGAIFSPVHIGFTERELKYVLTNSIASALFVQRGLTDSIADDPRLQAVLPRTVVRLEDLPDLASRALCRRRAASQAVIDLPEDAPVLISYTSGMLDRDPAPVTRSHGCEIWNATTYADIWDIRPGDSVLIPLPLSWVYGLSTLGLSALSVGATIILQSFHDREAFLPAVERFRVSVFAGTMGMYSRLLGELQDRVFDHSSLRRLYVGGESVALPIVNLVEHYTGIRPLQAYAVPEVAPALAVDPVRDISAPAGTVGRVAPGSEVRLVDAAGDEVPVGEVGEAWLRGKGRMLGYWNEPSLTRARVTSDGWYRSGDFLWRDAEGFHFMVGRGDDVVLREGSLVGAAEIESALTDLAAIGDAVAVAVPDEEFGETFIAFVAPNPGVNPSIDTIYDELGARVARHRLPSEIYILTDLPLDYTGKRDRNQLRRLAYARRATDRVVVTMADWSTPRSRGPRA